MCGNNPELQERIAMALSAAKLVCVLHHGLTEIALIISVYLLFTFTWPFLYLSVHIFFFVSSNALLRKTREKSYLLLTSKRRYRWGLNWNFNFKFIHHPFYQHRRCHYKSWSSGGIPPYNAPTNNIKGPPLLDLGLNYYSIVYSHSFSSSITILCITCGSRTALQGRIKS